MQENLSSFEQSKKHHLFFKATNEGICYSKKSTKWQDEVLENQALLNWDKIDQFDQFLAENEINKQFVFDITIEIINSSFLLLPNEFNSPLYQLSFLEKALGSKETIGKELHEQICSKEESILLFLVKSDWKDIFSFKFPLAKIHYEHIFANLINSHNRFLRSQLNIYLMNQWAFIICRKNGKLQIANAFEYHSSIELAFYIHSIRESFELVWNNDLIQIAGPEANNISLVESLQALKIPISIK
ncbi:DUF3822 family protein [Aquirufa sp. ROCK-SH2]